MITFIYFKKALQTTHRSKMLQILKAYGIPDRLREAISTIHRNNNALLVSLDRGNELLIISAGVLQWTTLSPFLFVMILDYELHKVLLGPEE